MTLNWSPENSEKREQKCGSCKYATKCYSERTSPRNVVINILACRIRMRITDNQAAKLLLEMVRPSLVNLVNNARARVGSGYIDTDYMIRDLESRIIECLIDKNGYKIGEPAYLTEYLFGNRPSTGWVKKWILWHFSKHQRFFKRHVLFGDNPQSDSEEEMSDGDRNAVSLVEEYNTYVPDQDNRDIIKALTDIVDDGITLNANEYRVISFCLAHANESNKSRLIDGTHTYLSTAMGVSRPRITRLFAVARKKLLVAAKQHGLQFA